MAAKDSARYMKRKLCDEIKYFHFCTQPRRYKIQHQIHRFKIQLCILNVQRFHVCCALFHCFFFGPFFFAASKGMRWKVKVKSMWKSRIKARNLFADADELNTSFPAFAESIVDAVCQTLFRFVHLSINILSRTTVVLCAFELNFIGFSAVPNGFKRFYIAHCSRLFYCCVSLRLYSKRAYSHAKQHRNTDNTFGWHGEKNIHYVAAYFWGILFRIRIKQTCKNAADSLSGFDCIIAFFYIHIA